MLPTLVLTDACGSPTGPAVTWEDARAEEYASELRDGFGPDELYRLTGQWVDGRYLIPMARRLRDAEPGRFGRATRLLGAKDYLYGELTGEYLTDPSTATGTGCYDLHAGGWITSLTDGLPALPGIAPARSCLPLGKALADAGVPPDIGVCLGGADSVLGAVGLGMRRQGQVAYIAGTSSVILAYSAAPVIDHAHRHLITPVPGVGGLELEGGEGWGLEMDLLSTGSAHDWLARLVAGGDRAVLADLAAGVDAEEAPVFLPYLLPGEQGSRWDPDLAGTVAGLNLTHGPGHLARALRTGIVTESRRCLALLADAASTAARSAAGEIFLAGGGGASLATDLADATGRVVHLAHPDRADSSAIGAAMLAASAVDGIEVPVPSPAVTTEPSPAGAARWERLATRHEAALAAISPLYHESRYREDTR